MSELQICDPSQISLLKFDFSNKPLRHAQVFSCSQYVRELHKFLGDTDFVLCVCVCVRARVYAVVCRDIIQPHQMITVSSFICFGLFIGLCLASACFSYEKAWVLGVGSYIFFV